MSEREAQGEHRSAVRTVRGIDTATDTRHRPICDRQPQARPALSFSAKERIENTTEMLWRNPLALVFYSDHYGFTLAASRNANCSADGHRILGIQQEIEKNLTQLSRVAKYERQCRNLHFHPDRSIREKILLLQRTLGDVD